MSVCVYGNSAVCLLRLCARTPAGYTTDAAANTITCPQSPSLSLALVCCLSVLPRQQTPASLLCLAPAHMTQHKPAQDTANDIAAPTTLSDSGLHEQHSPELRQTECINQTSARSKDNMHQPSNPTFFSLSASPAITSSSSCFFWLLNSTANCMSPTNGSAGIDGCSGCCDGDWLSAALLPPSLPPSLPTLLLLLLFVCEPVNSAWSYSSPVLKFCSATSAIPMRMRSVAVCVSD